MGAEETDWRGARRGRLLDAASRVFTRHGYETASMDEIASEAGVGKPTLYRYFDGKAALFVAVFLHTLDRLEIRLEEVLRREAGPSARLRAAVLALTPTFRDHLVPLHMLGQDGAAIDRSMRLIFRERRARIAEYLARAVDIPGATADPLRTAHLVIGMIWSGTAGLAASDAEIADEIAHLVLHGLAPRREKAGDAVRPAGSAPRRSIAETVAP